MKINLCLKCLDIFNNFIFIPIIGGFIFLVEWNRANSPDYSYKTMTLHNSYKEWSYQSNLYQANIFRRFFWLQWDQCFILWDLHSNGVGLFKIHNLIKFTSLLEIIMHTGDNLTSWIFVETSTDATALYHRTLQLHSTTAVHQCTVSVCIIMLSIRTLY